MTHHERTRIVIEMESTNGALGEIDIEVKCWDKNKAVKTSREEVHFIASSIFTRALNYMKGGEE